MVEDAELLAGYAGQRSETAFAELVRRHINVVDATALRLAGGDAHLAQDITQTVFIELARQAAGRLVAHHHPLHCRQNRPLRSAAPPARTRVLRHERE